MDNRNVEARKLGTDHELRAYSFDIRATTEDGTIEGYASVFGVKDSYADIIEPGAFVKSLADHKVAGTNPAMLWQHNQDQPLGVWTEMAEDGQGLRVKGKLALDTIRGKEAHSLLKMGALNGLSIGFVSKEWSYDRETNIRKLSQVDLWEVSLVTFPANHNARITGVKNIDSSAITTLREAEKALRDADFSDKQAKAFIALVKRIALDERDARDAELRAKSATERLLKSLTSN